MSPRKRRAIGLGRFCPCSHERTVEVAVPRKSAKTGWLNPSDSRISRTFRRCDRRRGIDRDDLADRVLRSQWDAVAEGVPEASERLDDLPVDVVQLRLAAGADGLGTT